MKAINPSRHAFSLIETVIAVAIIGLVIVLLVPISHRQRQGSGLVVSLNNTRAIGAAWQQYTRDTGFPPIRGSSYWNGQMDGWNSWHFGGGWCDRTGRQPFGWYNTLYDEVPQARPLNPYLLTDIPPGPPGLVTSTGAGATWTFAQAGVRVSPLQRRQPNPGVFASPGDVVSYQGAINGSGYGSPSSSGVSGSDREGTSYHVNLQWWDDGRLPSNWTQRMAAGTRAISGRATRSEFISQRYVLFTDQITDVVYSMSLQTGVIGGTGGVNYAGEFGGTNRSVMAFADGSSEYVQIPSGPRRLYNAEFVLSPLPFRP